jgi:hypothetical protein
VAAKITKKIDTLCFTTFLILFVLKAIHRKQLAGLGEIAFLAKPIFILHHFNCMIGRQ